MSFPLPPIIRLVKPTEDVLWAVAEPVTDLVTEVAPYWRRMGGIVNDKRALGLAAPQVGVSRRFFVWNTPFTSVVVNPAILARPGLPESLHEGCLSFPGQRVAKVRPSTITAQWSDERGVTYHRTLYGIQARVFQHECDHLDGVNLFPRPAARPPPGPEETKGDAPL
jgi:peptide deformylase